MRRPSNDQSCGVQPRPILQAGQRTGVEFLAQPAEGTTLIRRQSGVASRAQLANLGLTRRQVQWAISDGRWQLFGRNVVVLGNTPLTREQREWVAVLMPGKPAALAGLSAATSAGLQRFEPDDVHVVVRHATHVAAPAWVKIHESRRFTADDIAPASSPPRTRAARAVIDAATWSDRPRRACTILCAAVQQRVATAGQLERELRRAGHVRHVAIMRDILGDIGGGGHTLAEIELGALACKAGLPSPRRQRLRKEPGGKVRWLDAEFDLPDGTVLVVEVDGSAHTQIESWVDDSDRQNEIVIGGRPVLRFPSLTIRLDERRVVDQLRRMRLAHA
jgi:hypothetical protein